MTEREKFEAHWCRDVPDMYRASALNEIRGNRTGKDGYERDEIRWAWDAWQASGREALEEAAKVCDGIAVDRWNLYKGRKPYTGAEPGRANPSVQGESDGADSCAAAIRALSQKEAPVIEAQPAIGNSNG